MEKVKKIINSISWVIVALTGILLIVKWNDIPALVITGGYHGVRDLSGIRRKHSGSDN